MDKTVANLPFDEIEGKLNYVFNNKKLLRRAFIHVSYANEVGMRDNDRMEFFGDAILEFIVSKYLYGRYPEKGEGELSAIRAAVVSTEGLKSVVDELDILRYLLVSGGAVQQVRQSKKMEADLYEAVVCAIYLDGGLPAAEKFVLETLYDSLCAEHGKDGKTMLNEYCQAHKLDLRYAELSRDGPDNAPLFRYGLYVDGNLVAEGAGSSKKAAQADAANKIIEKWGIN